MYDGVKLRHNPISRGASRLFLCLAISLVVLACHKAKDEHEKVEPTVEARQKYADAVERFRDFLDSGWVVSRWNDGNPEHQGDSLLWSGVALAALPCAEGAVIEESLAKAIAVDGSLMRHPSMPHSVSLDGAVGLYFGIMDRLKRCSAHGAWREAFTAHAELLRLTGRINRDDDAQLVPEFDLAADLIAYELGLRGEPGRQRAEALGNQAAAWAFAVKTARAACYRVHLGLLALQTVDGPRDAFCHATEGLDLPTVNHWCGRGGLDDFLRDFRYNEWEFRHQRCQWESPDGREGLETPGLDLLVALRAKYAL